MKNDSEKYTPVMPEVETPRSFDNQTKLEIAVANVLNRPNAVLRFPSDVAQVGPREIAVPAYTKGEVRILDEAFEQMILTMMGQDNGIEFIEKMNEMVNRKLYIARIR